jgi:hypothetical protein
MISPSRLWFLLLAVLGLLGVRSAAWGATLTVKNGSAINRYFYISNQQGFGGVLAQGDCLPGQSISASASTGVLYYREATTPSWLPWVVGSSDATKCWVAQYQWQDCTPAAVPITNYVATAYYGNDGVLTLPVRLALISGGVTNVLTNQWAKPGEGVQAELTRTNPFTWQYLATDPFNPSNAVVLASGQGGSVLSTNAPLPTVTTVAPVSVPMFTNVPAPPSPSLPAIPSLPPAVTNYSTAQDAVRSLDQNQGARQDQANALLRNVYVATYQASVAQVQAAASGAAVVSAAVQQSAAMAAASSLTVSSALNALQSSLANGGAASSPGGGIPTNSPSFELGGFEFTNGFGGLSSSFGLPSGGDSSIDLTLPLGSLGIDGLDDQTVDVLGGSVGSAASTVRAFALAIVSACFAFLFFRLIRGLYA